MSEWQPMETAPKKRRVLVFVPEISTHLISGVFTAVLCGFTGCWIPALTSMHFPTEPTHWMPLPDPPSSQGGATPPEDQP